MAKIKARLTMFAEPVEVDDSELPHLRSQGLLIEDEPAAKDKPAPKQARGAETGTEGA